MIATMFKSGLTRFQSIIRQAAQANRAAVASIGPVRCMSHSENQESDEEFDKRYIDYFSRKNIDGWEIRKGMNDICSLDLVPDPKIVIAALQACRRVNDYALAIRILEAVKEKCGSAVNEIFPYVMQEVKPTLQELGINTLEEMGYDKPELALESVFEQNFRK